MPHHVVVDRRRVWITDHGGARVVVLDPSGRRLRTLRTPAAPHHVALLQRAAVVVGVDGTVSSYDATSGRPLYRPVRTHAHAHGVALVWGP